MLCLEYISDLGHHVSEQYGDDAKAHDRQYDRVKQRPENLLPHRLARFGVFRQALEHRIQVTGLLARGNSCAIDLREDAWKIGQSVGEGVTFHHLGAHTEHDALHPWLLGLLRYG